MWLCFEDYLSLLILNQVNNYKSSAKWISDLPRFVYELACVGAELVCFFCLCDSDLIMPYSQQYLYAIRLPGFSYSNVS